MTRLGASALPRRFSASMSARAVTCVLPDSVPDGTLVEGDEGVPPPESPHDAARLAMAAASTTGTMRWRNNRHPR